MDQNDLIFEWNHQAEVIFGRKKEEVIGKRLADMIIPSRFYFAHKNGVRHFLKTGVGPILNNRTELTALRRDGSEFPIELIVTPIKINDFFVFFAFVRDISDRKLIEAELKLSLSQEKAAREAAEKAIAVRDEFLLIAAHELRTPITSLMLNIQMIRKFFEKIENKNPMEIKEVKHLSAVQSQLDRLNRLIEKVLDISKISTGKLQLKVVEVDLSAVVLGIVATLQGEYNLEGYHFEVHAAQPTVGLWDHTRIEQVVTNLLTNAVKYGKRKPIDIRVESNGEEAILIVKDHGIGIAKNDQTKIFKKFERFSSSEHYPGIGLGLYITQQIIEAHGGSIEVESNLGEGATFTVKLPLQV